MSQNLAQQRAADALTKINAMADEEYGQYVSYVSSLPAEIIMSGLGQAMAMIRSKKLSGYSHLYEHIMTWLCADRPYENGDLLRNIVDGTETDYIRAQAEAMAYLEWLKKFAVALLNDDDPRGDLDAPDS